MMKSKSLPILVGAATLGALALLSSPAGADLIDANISVGTGPPTDPQILTNTTAIPVAVMGSDTEQNPLLIIVGAYDGNGTPSISFSGCATPSACPAATVGTYGLTANTGTFNAASPATAYDVLGLSSGGNESFGNWSLGDTNHGFAPPTSFSLFAFALPTELTSSGITIDESGAAAGSYIIAYSCKLDTGTPGAACDTNGDRGQTPFTTAGLVVPAPVIGHGLLVLLAVGGVLFGGKLIESLKKHHLRAA
jgi:hypothetical protein